jgi:hypothetical protein
LQQRSLRWVRPKSTQCKLSFLYSRIHRDRVLLIILYYNKTHERAGGLESAKKKKSRDDVQKPRSDL